GIELQAAVRVSERVNWNANLTVSRNRIDEYREVLTDYGADFSEYNLVENIHRDTEIAFSPSVIAGSGISFVPFEGLDVTLMTKYVGRQYLENTSNKGRSIPAYLVNDLRLSYTWKPQFVKAINFSLLINNPLDEAYESNGFTYGYLAGPVTYRENFYFP